MILALVVMSSAHSLAQDTLFKQDWRVNHIYDSEQAPRVPDSILPHLDSIHIASAHGDVSLIRSEIADGVLVDLRVSTGNPNFLDTTPLMWAVIFGQAQAVRVLLEAGADVNTTNSAGITPLMMAAGTANALGGDPLSCVQTLLEHGAKVDSEALGGLSALSFACSGGARFFFPVDPQPTTADYRRTNVRVSGGVSYLGVQVHRLARYGDAARVRTLLDAGASSDGIGTKRPPLEFAVMQSEVDRVHHLLESGASVDRHVLRRAARFATADVFGAVLESLTNRSVLDTFADELLTWSVASPQDSGEKTRALIAAGIDISSLLDEGRHLYFAASRPPSDGTSIPVLLNAGVEPIVQVRNDDSILIAASAFSAVEAVHALLDHRFLSGDRSNAKGRPTALMLASASNRDAAEKVRVLLSAGAHIDAESDMGETALLFAARVGNMDAIIELVNAGANVNVVEPKRGSESLQGGTGVFRVPGMTPLMYVANRGAHPLLLSEQTGEKAARVLIAAGADVEATLGSSQATALTLALEARHPETVDLLIEAGGLPEGESACREMVEVVIESRDARALSILLNHGVDPDTQLSTRTGWMPALAYACIQCDPDTVRTLVAAGADVNAPGRSGLTPLMALMQLYEPTNASVDRALAIIDIFLEHETDLSRRDDNGKTVLMYAAASNNVSWGSQVGRIIEQLISSGAAVDARDANGRTSLHHAALGFYSESIQVLLRAGAMLDVIDEAGRTPLDIAREKWGEGYAPSLRLLEVLSR